MMKKILLVTASFLILGALLISPLYAMDVEEQENLDPYIGYCSLSCSKAKGLEGCRNERNHCLRTIQENGNEEGLATQLRNCSLNYTEVLQEYRNKRDSYLEIGFNTKDKETFARGSFYAYQVTNFENSTLKDWQTGRNAYIYLEEYATAAHFAVGALRLFNNFQQLADIEIALILCLKIGDYSRAFDYHRKIIEFTSGEHKDLLYYYNYELL